MSSVTSTPVSSLPTTVLASHTSVKNDVAGMSVLVTVGSVDTPPRVNGLLSNTCLALIVDVSSSMKSSGVAVVRACVDAVLEQLDDTCSVSIILPHRFPAIIRAVKTTADGKARLREVCVSSLGGTNLTRACIVGADQLHRQQDFDHRVMMLFTDGQQTVRDASWDDVSVACRAIPLYAYSVGDLTNVRELYLIATRSLGGHYNHIRDTSDVAVIIPAHMQMLKNAICHNVSLTITSTNGVRIYRVFGPGPCSDTARNADRSPAEIDLPLKRYTFDLGTVYAGHPKVFLCQLSLREIWAYELIRTREALSGVQPRTDITTVVQDPNASMTDHHVFTAKVVGKTSTTESHVIIDRDTNVINSCNTDLILAAEHQADYRSILAKAILLADDGDLSGARRLIDETLEAAPVSAAAYIGKLIRARNTFNDGYQRSEAYSLIHA
jgi:hypothetical protein